MSLPFNRIYKLSTVIVILASFIPVSLISRSAECAVADSEMILPSGKVPARKVDTEKIRSMLENKIVADRLKSLRLSKEEVMAKMDKMSDEQIHQLASLSFSNRVSLAAAYYRGGYVPAETLILIVFLTAMFVTVLVVAIAVAD
jgi:hypothetical protein